MTVAEHRELNEIYCKSCYRLYIGPDGYGYPPNGPALIAYDMEHQDPPPGAGIKRKIPPPTRLGKTFVRKKTLPPSNMTGSRSRFNNNNTNVNSTTGSATDHHNSNSKNSVPNTTRVASKSKSVVSNASSASSRRFVNK